MCFLNKSYGDWANLNEQAIVPVATEEICTIDKNNEINVPDHIPFDHGTENESNSDNGDNIGKGNNVFVHRHGNYVSDDEDSEDGASQESADQEDCEANDADVN